MEEGGEKGREEGRGKKGSLSECETERVMN